MKLSLIIATYNRPDTLELTLKSINQQYTDATLPPAEIEVLIADDGSKADTAQLIQSFQKKFFCQLTHVWHEDNGFRLAAIRNLAVSKSSGKYLVFIDGDCIVAKDFLLNQYRLTEKGYFVGGNRVLLSKKYTQKVLLNKNISIVEKGLFNSFWAGLVGNTNKLFSALRLNFNAAWRKKHTTNWRRPKGCNMAVWRVDYIRVNGFDENFTGWGHEDADFLIRLLHAGVQIKDGRFAVPVYHLWHSFNERINEVENMRRLMIRVNNEQMIKAEKGYDQYNS